MSLESIPAFLCIDRYQLPEHRYAGICPYAERIRAEFDPWCNQMTYLSDTGRQRYCRQNLSYASSRSFPHVLSFEHAKLCALALFWMTLFDDYHERCEPTELAEKRDRIIDILGGARPRPGEHPLLAKVTDFSTLAAVLMPPGWLNRYAATVDDYFRRGVAPEASIRRERRVPSFAELVDFRPYTIAMFPYFLLVETQLGCSPPERVIEHPVILRIKHLLARIEVWQNDAFSLQKELSRPRAEAEVINLAFVLRQERGLTLEEACTEMLRIHDADVAEFRGLSDNLPDFGEHQRDAERYVHHLALTVTGLETWYRTDTGRYALNGTWAGEHAPAKD